MGSNRNNASRAFAPGEPEPTWVYVHDENSTTIVAILDCQHVEIECDDTGTFKTEQSLKLAY